MMFSNLRTLLFVATSSSLAHADWPQWRGGDRSGVSADTTPLLSSLPESGFSESWTSSEVPSDHYGGHSSPVVAGGRVYLSMVWHERVPSETRVIDAETIQAFNTRGVPKDLAAKMEEARLNLNPRLRGDKLEEFIAKWNEENLTPEQKLSLGSWVASRFKAGRTAIGLEWLDKISSKQEKPFANAAALEAWLDEEKFPPEVKQKVIDTVPNTVKVANDTVLALDAKTGKEVWKFATPGEPTGRRSSATPAIVGGKIYSMGSTHLYCLNEADGKLLWKTPLTAKGPGSSPLVMDGKVFTASGRPAAYDASNGKLLWEVKAIHAGDGSPAWWAPSKGPAHVVINTSKTLLGLSAQDGKQLWEAEGGSQSTPVTSGDHLVIYSGTQGVGLRAYEYQAQGAPKVLWSHYWLTRRYAATPIITNGLVFAMGGDKHLCVDLLTGKKYWEETCSSAISSPLLADGKIFVQENNGTHIRVVKASAEGYEVLGRAKAAAMGCASPAIGGGQLVVRQKDRLVSFDVRSPVP